MIATIERACQLLAARTASPIEVARGLGQVVEGAAGDHEIVVRPADASVATATVVARIDAPEADLVVLEPAPGSDTTVGKLAAAFGPYREGPPARPGSPRRLTFRPNVHGPTHTCAVVAAVSPEPGDVADRAIERVTVRREEILA